MVLVSTEKALEMWLNILCTHTHKNPFHRVFSVERESKAGGWVGNNGGIQRERWGRGQGGRAGCVHG